MVEARVDYDQFCTRCKQKSFEMKRGIVCKLTDEKPDFIGSCPDFDGVPAPKSNQANIGWGSFGRAFDSKVEPRPYDPKKSGIALIVLGVVHLLIPQIFLMAWGFILIVLGILNIVLQNNKVIIFNAIALLIVGLSNILASIPTLSIFWIAFGTLQLYWGSQRFVEYRKLPPVSANEDVDTGKIDPKSYDDVVKKYSTFSLIALWLSILGVLLMFFGSFMLGYEAAKNGLPAGSVAPVINIWSLIFFFSLPVTLVGFIVAIISFFDKSLSKIPTMIAIILCLLNLVILWPGIVGGLNAM